MLPRLVSLAILAAALGCQRPEVEAFRRQPVPILVRLEIPPDTPGGEQVRQEYAAALRARLATRSTVVVEGARAPEDAAELQVNIRSIRSGDRPASAAAVGVATGIAVGTLSALAGNRHATFDGFWWGLWAGSHAAAERRHSEYSLGYRPNRVNAVVTLRRPALARQGRDEVLADFDVDGREVIQAMRPLGAAEREDEFRIREEEARAFARVVVEELERRFEWTPRSQPSFYGLPEREPDPRPAEAPAVPRKDGPP
ncbi:MAG: hypothetical protein HY823_09010 [Acidobacteria bacterium]|nr:hypothetical protein [Acidobacteriota bacterium]